MSMDSVGLLTSAMTVLIVFITVFIVFISVISSRRSSSYTGSYIFVLLFLFLFLFFLQSYLLQIITKCHSFIIIIIVIIIIFIRIDLGRLCVLRCISAIVRIVISWEKHIGMLTYQLFCASAKTISDLIITKLNGRTVIYKKHRQLARSQNGIAQFLHSICLV